jgi:serine protease Do
MTHPVRALLRPPQPTTGFCRTLIAFLAVMVPTGTHSAEIHDVCQRLQSVTVRIVSGTDRSSGVIVSAAGHIVTTRHGLQADRDRVTIVTANGDTWQAAVLGRSMNADAALLKIDPGDYPRAFPFIAFGTQIPAATDDFIMIAAGYPGREPTALPPVIRTGTLRHVSATLLRSDCLLTAGDSGGPLIDSTGSLIAIHRQIGAGTEHNLHVPVAVIRKELPALDAIIKTAPVTSNPSSQQTSRPSLTAFQQRDAQRRTVRIEQHIQGRKKTISCGLLLDQQHVATKLSSLQPGEEILCRLHHGPEISGRIVIAERASDLAILEMDTHTPHADNFKDLGLLQTLPKTRVFDWAFATTDDRPKLMIGIITRVAYAEPEIAGRLGAELVRNEDRGVTVKQVDPNSTLATAGIQKDDLITAINERPVQSLEDVSKAMLLLQPGDWITFTTERRSISARLTARLQNDPAERFERAEFLDGLAGERSPRRTGFASVLQTELSIGPTDCGRPLLNQHGEVIGMIIARRSRESTLALPLQTVLDTFGRL